MASAICLEPRFIYVHIPKTGGTSFMSRKSQVYKDLGCEIRLMGGHTYLRTIIQRNGDNFFKFTIVRNPYDRFISLWKVRASNKSLRDFIHDVKCGHRWYALKPQSKWISVGNKLLVDHVVKFENYEEGLNNVLEKLGLPRVSIPHLRKTDREKDYRQYYDEEARNYVSITYFEDIKNFNYLF